MSFLKLIRRAHSTPPPQFDAVESVLRDIDDFAAQARTTPQLTMFSAELMHQSADLLHRIAPNRFAHAIEGMLASPTFVIDKIDPKGALRALPPTVDNLTPFVDGIGQWADDFTRRMREAAAQGVPHRPPGSGQPLSGQQQLFPDPGSAGALYPTW